MAMQMLRKLSREYDDSGNQKDFQKEENNYFKKKKNHANMNMIW